MSAAASRPPSPVGTRVLVLEDELLIAMFLDDLLVDAGYLVLGPASTVAEALAMLAAQPAPDIALLDFHVAGETSLAVADALAGRGVPMVFLTGYGPEALPQRYRDRPVLTKPYEARELIAALTNTLRLPPAPVAQIVARSKNNTL